MSNVTLAAQEGLGLMHTSAEARNHMKLEIDTKDCIFLADAKAPLLEYHTSVPIETLKSHYPKFTGSGNFYAAAFSREAVLAGSLEQYAAAEGGKKGVAPVDAEFLMEIERWREMLARNIALRPRRVLVGGRLLVQHPLPP